MLNLPQSEPNKGFEILLVRDISFDARLAGLRKEAREKGWRIKKSEKVKAPLRAVVFYLVENTEGEGV